MAFFIIFYLLNYTSSLILKLHGKMKEKLAYYEVESTGVFVVRLSLFMATYRTLLCRYCRLWSQFMSPQLKNRFFEAKR